MENIEQKDLETMLEIMNNYDICTIEKWEHDTSIEGKIEYYFHIYDKEGFVEFYEV